MALRTLEAFRAALALAEPESPGQSAGQPLAQAISPVYYRTKAAYVLWMLRDLAGDSALSAALREIIIRPRARIQASPPNQAPLKSSSKRPKPAPDLAWFFADWVDADKGLPDLSIEGVFPSRLGGNWLVAVNVANSGYAAAEVPVTVRSAPTRSPSACGSRPRQGDQRILIQGKPTEVQVNDGTVPETQASVHITNIARPHLEPDRRALEAEGLADLVFQEALEAEVQLDVAVGEEHKGRRGDGGLRHVEDAHPLGHRHRRALEVDRSRKRFICPVETRLRRSAATATTSCSTRSILAPAQARSFERGEKDHRRVAQVLEHRAQLLLEDLAIGGRLAVGAARGHRVPLVHHDDDAAPALVGIAADGGVGRRHALGRVEHQQGHVRGFQVPPRHHHAHLFGHQVGLALAPDAGRIHKANWLPSNSTTSSTASRVVPAMGETMAREVPSAHSAAWTCPRWAGR
jgi:hypothetical protein